MTGILRLREPRSWTVCAPCLAISNQSTEEIIVEEDKKTVAVVTTEAGSPVDNDSALRELGVISRDTKGGYSGSIYDTPGSGQYKNIQ